MRLSILEPFRKASISGKVKDLSAFTHELWWIKSPSEVKLMRESASIACQIKDGDLVLMDIGCELHGYLSDLTRTWPTSGHFSPAHVITIEPGIYLSFDVPDRFREFLSI